MILWNTGYTIVTNTADFIAIDNSKNSYIEISNDIFITCQGQSLLKCPVVLPIMHRPYFTCTASLFLQQDSESHKTCDIKININQPVSTKIFSTQPGHYLISTQSNQY